MKIFLEVKKFKKLFCGLSCENFNIGSVLSCNVFLNVIETVLLLELCFEKVHNDPWQLVKISRYHNIIIIIINLFFQVFNVSVSSAQRQIFVIARVFDIMQFDMLQKYFNCSYRGSTSLPMRIIEPSTYWTFTCSKSAIETLGKGIKSVPVYL